MPLEISVPAGHSKTLDKSLDTKTTTGAPGEGQGLRRGPQDETQVRCPRGLGAGAMEKQEAGRLVPEGKQVQAHQGAGACSLRLHLG